MEGDVLNAIYIVHIKGCILLDGNIRENGEKCSGSLWILGIGIWLAFWEAGRIWKTEMLKKDISIEMTATKQ